MGRKGGYETLPLTFHVLEGSGSFYEAYNAPPAITLEMRHNGGAWVPLAAVQAVPGDIIEVRGNGYPSAAIGRWRSLYFTSGVKFEVYGNIMSIPYGDNFADKVAITQEYGFYSFFHPGINGANAGMVSAANLVLPALELSEGCYYQMFYNCMGLVEAPEIKATTLAQNCCYQMFMGCAALASAPELPATTLASRCYCQMFRDCSSLLEAPDLPATTLATDCYYGMFYGCSALTKAPSILPATTLAENCYREMFIYCSALLEAPDIPATTLAKACCRSMFYGCTSLILAPELEAPILTQECYRTMFQQCNQLAQIICTATDISATDALASWILGVAAQGTFYKRAGVTWPSGNSGIPSGWSVIEV